MMRSAGWMESIAARAGAIGAMLIASAVVTGCSVESTGVTGVGIDESGGLVGYVQVCSGRIDNTTLYETDGVDEEVLGHWNAPGSVTDFAMWSLEDPGDWTATQRYTRPSAHTEYSLFGSTKDDSTSSLGVTFRLQDLDGMKPGEVLYARSNGIDRSPSDSVVTETEFRRHGCDDM